MNSNDFKLRTCGKCRGDLTLDEGDWLCLQCGTYYYTGLYASSGNPRLPGENSGRPPKTANKRKEE